ncbi:thioesterase II family protein [Dactylosporangium sp. CA-092794]|uniref:thioesterase II family protein n=1 Tax=Dactylosporangium sp. CA-092794 TaxID=3239929 RepID=UPI003D91FDF7
MTTPRIDRGLWTRTYHPADPGAARLVCLPHAGGSATFFFPVSRALSPGIEVVAIQYPGRQDRRREPLVPGVPELARLVFEVVRPFTDRPLALFGHSLGASVAFEVARLLERDAGAVPVRLFVSGRRAPSRHRQETVHLLDDAGLLADVRRLSGTDAAILGDEDFLRMALPSIRNDYRAAETYSYVPGPPLACPITVFTGDDDPKTTTGEAAAWGEHTTGGSELEVFAGGHFFLTEHQPEILRTIAERMTAGRPD